MLPTEQSLSPSVSTDIPGTETRRDVFRSAIRRGVYIVTRCRCTTKLLLCLKINWTATMKMLFRNALAFVSLLSLGLACSSALAATDTWIGGSLSTDNWSDTANWSATSVPSSGDIPVFAGTTRPTPNDDLANLFQIDGINFASGAGAFTLGPNGNNITLADILSASTAPSGDIINNSANAETIKLGITLGVGSHAITTTSGAGALNLTGPITRSTGATAVFTTGGGAINVSGSGLANDSSGVLALGPRSAITSPQLAAGTSSHSQITLGTRLRPAQFRARQAIRIWNTQASLETLRRPRARLLTHCCNSIPERRRAA